MKCTGTTTRSLSPQCWTALAKSLLAALLLLGLLAGQQVPVASAADPSVTLTAIGGGGTHGLPNGAFAVTSNCDTGVDTDVNEEYRVALEFDLSSIPSGAEIQAAYLRLRTGRPDLVGKTAVYAYAGSGTIEAGDMTAGSLVVTYTPSTSSPQSVDVTAAVLARWQNSQRWAGFTLRQDPLGSTYGGWDCPGYYAEPLLTITYTTPDSTPPVITPNIVGTKGTNDWYTSDVSVSWSVTDAESPVTSQTGCDTQNITADTTGVTFTCSATSAGGSDTRSVTVKRDATAPVLAPTISPNPPTLNLAATSSPNASDATSGVASASCTQPDTTTTGAKSLTCSATDNAGNTATTQLYYTVVTNAPTIAVTPGGTCSDGGPSGTIKLTVGAATGAASLTLRVVSNSNTQLVANSSVVFGGTGANAGKELELTKNLTTLGKPGVQVAVITRRPHGYFITHVEGANFPVVNGATLDAHPRELKDHDVIELAGVKMEFFIKG